MDAVTPDRVGDRARPGGARRPVDPAAMRTVLGHFCTGVAVLTGLEAGAPVGMTVQSLVSASLEPPLVLVCPQRSSTSWPRIARGGVFCANILSAVQRELGSAFSRSGGDKFTGVGWRPAGSGAPVLDDALAYVDCEIHAVHDAGDHLLVLGRVVELAATGDADPLLFYRGGFGALAG